MTCEKHTEAMRLWRMLENMSEPERRQRLENEESELYSTPCSASLTAVVFRRLEIDVSEWHIYWLKLYNRPVGRVWRFFEEAQKRKPEEYNGLLTNFAKRVPSLRDVA